MTNHHRRFLLAVFLVITFNLRPLSQQQITRYELGGSVGAFVYQGDLTPLRLGSFPTTRWGFNLFGSRILNPSFSIRANLAIGGLAGDDAKYAIPEYRRQRNFRFRSSLIELSGLLVWNPLQGNYEDRGFTPYIYGGAGLGMLRIRRDWSDYNTAYFETSDLTARLALDAAHSVPQWIPVIPLGAGLRYGFSPRIVLMAESSYRLVFTDYLDGFSKAANPERNDHYQTYNIGAIYRLGKKNLLGCPVIRY